MAVVVAVVTSRWWSTRDDRRAPRRPTPTDSADQPPAGATAPPLPPFKPSARRPCRYRRRGPRPSNRSSCYPDRQAPPTGPGQREHGDPTKGSIGLMLANNDADVRSIVSIGLAQQVSSRASTCHRLTTSPVAVLQCSDPKGDGWAVGLPVRQRNAHRPILGGALEQAPSSIRAGHGHVAPALIPNSSQFFMVYRDSKLPPQYTVFGTIKPWTDHPGPAPRPASPVAANPSVSVAGLARHS